ncbi:MAG: hypothetical protein U5R31_03235 [Acidimicrobiia bacterium]|nr:hypothetical protein [Acidimicrobiia bacterium]
MRVGQGRSGSRRDSGRRAASSIAVWALASQAERSPSERTLPTRIWYVVNRRLLVDAAYDHGLELQRMLGPGGERAVLLAAQPSAPARHQAVAPRSSSIPTAVLPTTHWSSRVYEAGPSWALDRHIPRSRPSCLRWFHVASRWLFRGYASSSSMQPIDAAHAGIDSLVLLDEAHSVVPAPR